jgi:hypothetical protein
MSRPTGSKTILTFWAVLGQGCWQLTTLRCNDALGLHRLIIANAAPSLKLWEQNVHHWLNKSPEDFREMLRRHERDGMTLSEEYQRGMKEFYNKYTCQVIPWSAELGQSFAGMSHCIPQCKHADAATSGF